MPRFVKEYIGRNVVDEAKDRFRRYYEEFDFVSVSFSGGKDSLACMYLAHDVAVEEGYTDKVHTLFLDEEVIHADVLDFVATFKDLPWVDLHWWCTPLRSHKMTLGVISDYVQWDPERDPSEGGVGWVRPKPPWAYTREDLIDQIAAWQEVTKQPVDPHNAVLSQYAASEVESMAHKGRYMQVCGMRTTESLLRYAMISSSGLKPSECHIGMPTLGRVYLGKPIYDWTENDVFKYLHEKFEEGLCPSPHPYAPIYDGQLYSKLGFRVGTALTSEAAGRLDRLRTSDPDLYEAVQRIFPDMTVHERYNKEFITDVDRMRASGELERATYATVQAWIDLELEGKWHTQATTMLRRLQNRPESYPPAYVMQHMVNGAYKRMYLGPDPKSARPNRAWVNGKYVDVDKEGVPV